jgi:hypothetical protein
MGFVNMTDIKYLVLTVNQTQNKNTFSEHVKPKKLGFDSQLSPR